MSTTLGDVLSFIQEMKARAVLFDMPEARTAQVSAALAAFRREFCREQSIGSLNGAYCTPCDTELGDASNAAFDQLRRAYGCDDAAFCSTKGCETAGATG